MAFDGAAMAAESMRAKVSRTLTLGVSTLTALLYIACYGVPKSASAQPAGINRFRPDFGWKRASGTAYEVKVKINRGKATQYPVGRVAQRDFEQRSHIDTASFSYYTFERTFAVSEDWIALNKDSKTKLVDILMTNQEMALEATNAAWVDVPHFGDESGHNAGVSILSPTAVAASTELGGIALDATDDDSKSYWKPGSYDYGTDTLAADFLTILGQTIMAARVSQKAGGGQVVAPDFGICDPLAWAKIMEFVQDNGTFNLNQMTNLSLMQAGKPNFNIPAFGLTLCVEDQYGGSTGYIDGAAAEEILVGHSSAINIVTTASKAQGLVQARRFKESALMTGVLGAFVSPPFAFVIRDPKKFALAYT